VYETMVNFTLPAGAAPGNGATEAGDVDVLAVRWAHPVDLRDTAVDSVDVLNDIEGPYVTEAYYYLGDPYDLDPANPDTLVVIFNERFVCAQTQAVSSALSALYNYTSKDPSVTEEAVFVRAVLAACASDTVTRLTVILGPDNGITPLRDSIAVKAGQLVDLLGNPSVDKPPAVIRYGRDYSWTSRNAPNPFQPAWGSNAGDQIPPAIIGSLDQTWVAQNNLTPAPSAGAVVEVISIKNPDLIQSNMLVLDALGNVVADRLPAYPVSNNPNKFYFFWDGYNRNRRVVGSGTYLARIFVYAEGESTPGVKQQKIGVRN